MGHLIAPNGKRIVATVETLEAHAVIGFVTCDGGVFEVDFEGTTNVDWDGQATKTSCGERVFQDEEGEEWLERELKFVEGEPAE